ncbi:hypothetical protein IL54_4938 [Sphingobium sp. ba1]|jgi:hypothetical protein|uniref:hypothetical protein n=1 Tax=Sphingobium sp. ba1 TaxID=1522072 RepID=UPI00056A9608|nr:hypothetical protein [Sphingobium sp. ba1]OMG61341.1 hypothetical protein IL54_4938 [Sphingobium sp. ba1]
MTSKLKMWAGSALKMIGSAASVVLPLVTRRNITMALGVATLFGLVAPETATDVRNVILAPAGVEESAGDLL